MKLILGSASKTRKFVLEEAGLPVDVCMASDFDELSLRSDDYAELPMLLARAKRDALRPKISANSPAGQAAFLITGDVVLFCGKRLLEKPQSAEEEREFFRLYDGKTRCGFVAAITVTNTATGETREGKDGGEFILGPFTESEVEAYIAQGTYMEYAGGFRYKDPEIKAKMVRLDGNLDALMGMPIAMTRQFLNELGWRNE